MAMKISEALKEFKIWQDSEWSKSEIPSREALAIAMGALIVTEHCDE